MGTRTITTKLAVEGEAQYKQAITSCNSELGRLKSALAATQSEFRNNANSLEALTRKDEALNALKAQQVEKVKTLQAALENCKKAVDAFAQQQTALKPKLEASNQAVAGLDAASKKAGEQWADYAQRLEASERALKKLETSSTDTSKEQAKLEAALAKTKAEMKALEESTDGAAREAGELLLENKKLNSDFEANTAKLDAATRGANNWEKQLNQAKIEVNKLDDQLTENTRYLDEAKNSADGCARSIDQYGKEVKDAAQDSQQFGNVSQEAVNQLAGALAAAGVAKTVEEIASELIECGKAAGKFEAALAKLSTLMVPHSMESIKASLIELSNKTGVAVGALAEAAYQARSAGVDAANVMDFLATAIKTSAAGFTDSAAAVDVLTTAINAYNLKGSEAERVASMLVKTQDEGKTSVNELAQNMGRVIPVAAAYNVNLGNLSTAYAILTKNGTNTAISTTNLSALFTELAREGSKVAGVLQEQTGKSFAQLMADGSNLGEVMAVLSSSVDGDATAFSNLWSSTTAGQAALTLLNAGAEEFTRTLGVMENSSGAVERNFQAMANTTEHAQQRMANAAQNLRIAVGDQLNPALERLYTSGADAFTWASDFVEEHPWVVGAIVGTTTALGALALGTAGLAAAPAIIGALNTALGLLQANPVVAVAAAVVGLTVAVGTWAASLDDADEKTKNFTGSLQDSKTAYDELTASMAKQRTSTRAMASSLKELLAAENKSALQKDLIQQKVEQLNQAVPELNLAYDREKDALVGVTEAELDSLLARTAAQEEYEAQVARLGELTNERAEIEERLTQARLALNEAQEAGTGNTRELQNTIQELTAAQEENQRQTEELEEASRAYGEEQAQAAARAREMEERTQELTTRMSELQEEYAKSLEAARQSIESQMGLFADLDTSANVSINDMIESLKRQAEYMDEYAANIQKAMELGVDKGLIQKLSDGSEASARILAEIVDSGREEIDNLNAEFRKVEQGKEDFSRTVAELETDFSKEMEEIKRKLNQTIAELDQHEDAWTAGQKNIDGLIGGTFSRSAALISAYTQMGKEALAAYKREVDQRSPSHKFEQAGRYDIQGIIQGAEEEKPRLAAAYAQAAQTALDSMERHLPSTVAEPPVTAAQDRQTAAILAAVSSRGGEDGGIHIHVDKLAVRSDSDVKEIARELYYMVQRERRSRGGGGL